MTFLTDLRDYLTRLSHSQYDEISEGEYPDGTLGAMQLSQDAAKAHMADSLLKVIPEEETDIVKKYRAARYLSENLDDTRYQKMVGVAHSLRSDALECVKDRIEVDYLGEDHVQIEDPISKRKFRMHHKGAEEKVDFHVHQLATDVIEEDIQ